MRSLVLTLGAAALLSATAASGQAESFPVVQPIATEDSVQPEAVEALKRMSDFLGSLNSFALTSNSTLDVVTTEGQKVQLGAVVKYKVTRPGIWIDFDGDVRKRQYVYDGKTFTLYAPDLKFYASTPAPATNREFLKTIYDKFGISLPLEDLFRWNDGDKSDLDALTSAFSMGPANVDGTMTDHWAFRQGDFDWEVWIEQGEQPLPRKLVIIDRTDPALPAYSARLDWTLNPALTAQDFAFVPAKDVLRIPLANLTEATQ